MPRDTMKAGESRVWHFPDGPGPGKTKEFLGRAKIGDPTYNFGDVEPIQAPDPLRYNEFENIDEIQGARENPTASIMARYPRADLSTLLAAGRKRCKVGVQAHMGKCQNPQDFNHGWDKIVFFPDAKYTSWSAENFGALASDEQAASNETGELSASDLYEGKRLTFGEQCESEISREIIAVRVCDQAECGDCDEPSDGCSKVFAVQLGAGATPGNLPSVVYSSDGGVTCASTDIDTLFSNEDPDDAFCVGSDFIVISSDGGMHIADAGEILLGTETWVEPTIGFVAGAGPIAIWSVDALHTWIVAEGGYVYFTASPRGGVTVQDPGVATTQDLQDVHALDSLNVVAVGALNAVIRTSNGGDTWETLTGPSVGNTLNTVWMYNERTWFIGDSIGGLFFTSNEGITWTAITDIAVALIEIDDIVFYDSFIGYMAARIGAADGIILKTLDGGASWYVLPESTAAASIPDNDRINSLAVCDDANTVWGGGLAGDGSDGILVKAA